MGCGCGKNKGKSKGVISARDTAAIKRCGLCKWPLSKINRFVNGKSIPTYKCTNPKCPGRRIK